VNACVIRYWNRKKKKLDHKALRQALRTWCDANVPRAYSRLQPDSVADITGIRTWSHVATVAAARSSSRSIGTGSIRCGSIEAMGTPARCSRLGPPRQATPMLLACTREDPAGRSWRWSDEDWNHAVVSLQERGWLNDDGLPTTEGLAVRHCIKTKRMHWHSNPGCISVKSAPTVSGRFSGTCCK
jgi:hypothetical protein